MLTEQTALRRRKSGLSNGQGSDHLKSRDSIPISASVQDINEMIDSLNNNYSQKLAAGDKPNSRNDSGLEESKEQYTDPPTALAGVASPTRPQLKLNITGKLSLQRASMAALDGKLDDRRRDTHAVVSTANHVKQPSLVTQISDFNQSVKRNSNYENIMKSTRQKIIQSHMMQSAQK